MLTLSVVVEVSGSHLSMLPIILTHQVMNDLEKVSKYVHLAPFLNKVSYVALQALIAHT